MMSQAMRKLSASINKTKTIAIFINQLREKVGVCLVILKQHQVAVH